MTRPGDRQSDDHEHAELYRLAQARRMLRCYQESTGKPAATTEDLAEWMRANPDAVPLDERGKVLPFYEDLDEEE